MQATQPKICTTSSRIVIRSSNIIEPPLVLSAIRFHFVFAAGVMLLLTSRFVSYLCLPRARVYSSFEELCSLPRVDGASDSLQRRYVFSCTYQMFYLHEYFCSLELFSTCRALLRTVLRQLCKQLLCCCFKSLHPCVNACHSLFGLFRCPALPEMTKTQLLNIRS